MKYSLRSAVSEKVLYPERKQKGNFIHHGCSHQQSFKLFFFKFKKEKTNKEPKKQILCFYKYVHLFTMDRAQN